MASDGAGNSEGGVVPRAEDDLNPPPVTGIHLVGIWCSHFSVYCSMHK